MSANAKRITKERTPMTHQQTRPRSTTAMYLINEALSRVRMRSPQNRSEALRNSAGTRGARRIAMQARREQARAMGNWYRSV
ncbi:hypothetical protein GCM10009681_52060 [Luedemannella helvata]|uniref:Uncharacterized protein n=1 Tax=Luedemannella helvata TaxID=349315 RepID=A0ABP4XD48_9ACTN